MKKLILLIVCSTSLMSQSAYFRLGYGDIFPKTDALSVSLGHSTVALSDSLRLGIHNPAALSVSNRVHFSVGLGSDFRSIDDVVSNVTRLEQVSFSFPLGGQFGMSLGTHAVADFTSDYAAATDMGSFTEHSSGGIWDFHIGMGYQVNPELRLGLKLHAFQGQIRRESILQTDDIKEVYVVKGDISGRSIEAGLISHLRDRVSIGLTLNVPYDPPMVSGEDSLAGTQTMNEIKEELTAWPTEIKLGVIYHRSERMNILLGIGQQLLGESGFNTARIFALPDGWETMPVATFNLALQMLPSDGSSRYWSKRIGWQLGFTTKNYYLASGSGKMINEYALTSGANLGLRNGRSIFEISGELGSRGGDESLPDELFARVKFGIQINDMWFRKVKRR